jgi:hypothetical protein
MRIKSLNKKTYLVKIRKDESERTFEVQATNPTEAALAVWRTHEPCTILNCNGISKDANFGDSVKTYDEITQIFKGYTGKTEAASPTDNQNKFPFVNQL